MLRPSESAAVRGAEALGSVDNQHCGGIFVTISLAAVFFGKNPRLPRQKCSQGVQPCCAFFLAFGHFLLKKPSRNLNVNSP
ncbi:hypothetical protein HMPREF9120_01502 [Neisseria sp. oral taxon 020 str. F0370]|nr:hypothetical protein HMPREF9120_01502 [Neisseria sp. oral taxon 020 str. F0370]